MDNNSQVFKLCGNCGNKRVHNDYHRISNPCEICVAKIQLDTIKLIEIKEFQDLNHIKKTRNMKENHIHNKRRA